MALHDAPCGTHFPRFVPVYGNLGDASPDSILLTVPRRLLDDANTGSELLLFMLLHEVGHGVRGTFNSLQADDWAARVGLALYYKEQWTPDFAAGFLERVISQLTAYMASQELPEIFGRASPALNEGEEYPLLGCRAKAIRGGYLAPTSGTCNEYGETCFANRLEGDEESLVRTYFVSRQCKIEAAPITDEIPTRAILFELKALCKRYPELCGRPSIHPGRIRREVRVKFRSLEDSLERELRRTTQTTEKEGKP
ncbi:MAG: hypothetical protein IPM68_19475 [Flavobacteriales bacterium]|nr:hypothetical protein [Flavobacteriales bacterium]